jgi:hypothetical protein
MRIREKFWHILHVYFIFIVLYNTPSSFVRHAVLTDLKLTYSENKMAAQLNVKKGPIAAALEYSDNVLITLV